MGLARTRRDVVRNFVGRPWWVTALGTGVVVCYAVATFFLGDFGGSVGVGTTHLGGAAGGFVAGFVRGTNVSDGLTAGLRAGVYGVAMLALLLVGGSFALWFLESGRTFLYWSPFFGVVGFVVLAPLYGMIGMAGGSLGVVVRRWVVPDHLNPSPR